MYAQELRTKTQQELTELLAGLKKDLREYSKKVLDKKEKNVKKPKFQRKNIARVLGVLKEQQIIKMEVKSE